MKISHLEEAARKKWCCQEPKDMKCGASDCMAWRWVETHIKDEAGNFTVRSGDTHGYCGLAGVPRQKQE